MTTEPIPPVPPRIYTPNPRDHWTVGSKLWAVLAVSGSALEAYGLWYDRTHPGNRGKWTLTSNARTVGGYDSVTGLPIDVPYGSLRRTALVLSLTWLIHHWTAKRGTF